MENAMAQQPFEIPQQLRDLTERNVEQARAAYGQFMDTWAQAMGTWASATPAGMMTAGYTPVRPGAVMFASQTGVG
jgi:hypothetical protein